MVGIPVVSLVVILSPGLAAVELEAEAPPLERLRAECTAALLGRDASDLTHARALGIAEAELDLALEAVLGDPPDGEEHGEEEEDAIVVETSTGTVRPKIELSDDELKRMWASDRAALGSISMGFPDAGRLVNGVPFPADPRWTVVEPAKTYATRETVEYLTAALVEVATAFPGTAPLRVNHISAKDGGWLRPHQTHQSGRDVDLAFYYKPNVSERMAAREKAIDPARNWALVRALATKTDVELILVDRRIQKVLYDHALSIGEDPVWLDSLFNAGRRSLVHHARRHRDHFHVRFYNPRAQALGRRLQPLLADEDKLPQLVRHVVRKGDSLGKVARKYGVTVSAIKRANGLKKDALRAGRALVVPVRAGACVRCPVVPEVVIPPRRLPPEPKLAAGS